MPKETATVYKAPPGSPKKYTVVFDNGKSVSFGARGYQDYTMHKDPERKQRYVFRHSVSSRESHGASGKYTAGFWAMHLLWNKPSLSASAKDIQRRFGFKVVLRTGSVRNLSNTRKMKKVE
jgi:hypothetical protein